MAGNSGAIEAGRAFVRLYLRDDMAAALAKSLSKSGKAVKEFGEKAMKAGAGISVAGAGLLAPIAAGVDAFTEMGGAAADAAARTGLSVQAISELGFAAQQTGAEFSDVETAVKKMAVAVTDLEGGSKTAADKFRQLGLTVADLQVLSPEQQFQKIAAAIAAIEDPVKRAAMAVDMFGKAGTRLLPMIAELETLRAKARALGIVLSDEDVAAADELGDSIDALKSQVKALFFQIGAGVSGPMKKLVKDLSGVTKNAIDFIRANRGLTVAVAGVGAVLLVAGAAVATLGAVLWGVGVALSAVGTIAGTVLSPLGLIATALVGGAYYWTRYTDSGRAAVASLLTAFAPLGQTISTALKGIGKSLGQGDLRQAGVIAGEALRLGMLQAIDGLAALLPERLQGLKDALGTVGDMIGQGDWAGLVDLATEAWSVGLQTMQAEWDTMLISIGDKFKSMFSGIWQWWSEKIQGLATEAGIKLGIIQTPEQQQSSRDQKRRDDIARYQKEIPAIQRQRAALEAENPATEAERKSVADKKKLYDDWIAWKTKRLTELQREESRRTGGNGEPGTGDGALRGPSAEGYQGRRADTSAADAERVKTEARKRREAFLARLGAGGTSVEDRAEKEYLREQDRKEKQAKLRAEALRGDENAAANDFAAAMDGLANQNAPKPAAAVAQGPQGMQLGPTFSAAAAQAGGQLGAASDPMVRIAQEQRRIMEQSRTGILDVATAANQLVMLNQQWIAAMSH
jgi:hypothetical protein